MRKRKLGHAFLDEVHKVNRPFGHFSNPKDGLWQDNLLPNYKDLQDFQLSPWRLVFTSAICILSFFLLFIRLFHMQIVSGSDNRQRADSNRIQVNVVHAPRGVIYDRAGSVLAENNPGYRLKGKFLQRDEVLKMEGRSDPTLRELEMDTIRSYPDGLRFSHIIGYTGEITEEELRDSKYSGYKAGDRIGRSGIESIYEKFLRGVDGAEVVEVDSNGKKIRAIRNKEPIPGNNLYLSIDSGLQKAAYDALETGVKKSSSCCGAAVALDPKTAEVLALVSLPSFDANAFNDPLKASSVSKYFTDSHTPLLNRAIAGVYPPGSTFKMVLALAALQGNHITPETVYEDTGVMRLGPYTFANWYFTQYGQKDGPVNVYKALQRSNDIYFYQLGYKMGEKVIGESARKLGFGKQVGVDLPGEVDGLVPDNEWKQRVVGEVWYPGDNLHLAIGQGYLLTTPIQILTLTGLLANDGQLNRPHLVTRITNPEGKVVQDFNAEPFIKNSFSQKNIEVVKEGMSLVTKDGGTAWPFFSFPIPTSGKTGTAEFGDPKGKTHAWYTSYAPTDNPTIAMTVLVEAGGEGSTVAGAISKDIYGKYFNVSSTPIATSSARILKE